MALTVRGHALLGGARHGEAAAAYQQALAIRRDLCQPKLATEPLAGLACVALAQSDVAAALAQTTEILAVLDSGEPFDSLDDPLWIALTCYRVLRAAQDPRAAGILTTAYTTLQERAASIPDESLRRMFLANVPYNRTIVGATKGVFGSSYVSPKRGAVTILPALTPT